MSQELTIVLQQSELTKEKADVLSKLFIPLYLRAKQFVEKASKINIKSADQIDDIILAKEIKKEGQRIRLDSEEAKDQLKADILKEGGAIDGLNRVIKNLVSPIENKLQEAVDFIKIQQEKKLDEMEEKRKKELVALEIDVTWFKLREMDEEKYKELLTQSQKEFDEKAEQAKKDKEAQKEQDEEDEKAKEIERKQNERTTKLYQIGLKWNSEFQSFVYEGINVGLMEMKMMEDSEFDDFVEKATAKKATIDKEEADAQAIKDEELQKEKDENARLKKDKEDREAEDARLETERLEKERLEEEEKQNALKAPDKEKLKALELSVAEIELPKVESDKAKEIVENVNKLLSKVGKYIRENQINL